LGPQGVVGIARFGDNSDSQIAISSDPDQLLALLVANDRHGADIFPPHDSGGHTYGVGRQATGWVLTHNFAAIHHKSLPTLKSEPSSILFWLSFIAAGSIPQAYPQYSHAYHRSLSVLSMPH